MSQGP